MFRLLFQERMVLVLEYWYALHYMHTYFIYVSTYCCTINLVLGLHGGLHTEYALPIHNPQQGWK